jgi:hypothetical protein
VAQVTISFDDYAYNDPYARCLAKSDTAAIDWMRDSYVRRAEQSIVDGEERVKLIYRRDIAHVMLLHIGGFQTVMLPRLLELLEKRELRLVTLEEAQNDPAYTIDPGLPTASGATLLDQMMAAKQIPATASSDDALARLDQLCR